MANSNHPDGSFSDFPEDVQLRVLSLLAPSDICSFSCTSKHFASLSHQDSKLWYLICERKWGSKTDIRKWGDGKVSHRLLFKTLSEYDNLIGFWRRIGGVNSGSAGESWLVYFEWGPSCLTGCRVSPTKHGGYGVITSPFIWMTLSSRGEMVTYLDPDCRVGFVEGGLDSSEKDLLQVNVSFIGKYHVVVDERRRMGIWGYCYSATSGSPDTKTGGKNGSPGNIGGQDLSVVEFENFTGSPPDRLMSEVYQYFANRTSPGASGDRAWRKQRRREKERSSKKRWEAEHFVKIVNCSPTPSRPIQGLWKGICDGMNLGFFLVSYDGVGGIVCRRVGDSSNPFHDSAPIFWTSDTTPVEPPFSPEEEALYSGRVHLRPLLATDSDISGHTSSIESIVSQMMFINSCYDLVIPDFGEASANPRQAEGRVWQYKNGMFGFGFLGDNFVVDLNHIAQDGCILDIMKPGGG